MFTLKKAVIVALIISHGLVFAAKTDKVGALKNEVVAKNVIATKNAIATKKAATKPLKDGGPAKNMTVAANNSVAAVKNATLAKNTVPVKNMAAGANNNVAAAKNVPPAKNAAAAITAPATKSAAATNNTAKNVKIVGNVIAMNDLSAKDKKDHHKKKAPHKKKGVHKKAPYKKAVAHKKKAPHKKKVTPKKNLPQERKNISLADNAIESSVCCGNSWSIGGEALYFRPTFGGNELGYSSFSNYGSDFFGNNVEIDGAVNYMGTVQPKRDLGFQVEVAYFQDKSNDINLNWYHLRDGTNGRFPEGTLFAGSASALYAGLFNVSSNWDAINLELGQYVYFVDLQALRLHAGVEFANIENAFTNYPQLTAVGNPVFITTDKIWYTGFGPRAGADFNYGMGKGFTVYGKIASSLLVGRAKQTVTGYRDLGVNLYSTGNYKQSNKSVVVPELEGKLGLKYDIQCSSSKLRFDVGYLWTTYFNSIISQVGAGIVGSSISNSTAANFGLNGVYCGLTWIEDVRKA